MKNSNIRISISAIFALFICLIGQSYAEPFAYITNFNDATVSVIDTETNKNIDTISVPTQPVGVAVHPSGETVYIAHSTTHNLSVLDATTNELKLVIDLGSGPRGMVVHPDGSKLYVAISFGNQVIVIDTITNNIIDRIDVGELPDGMSILPDGSAIYVVNALSNSISVIDTASNEVIDTFGYFPAAGEGIAVHPDGETVYILDSDEIAVIDTEDNTISDVIQLGLNSIELTVSPSGEAIYVTSNSNNTLIIIDTLSNLVTDTIKIGPEPLGIDVHPDGKTIYVITQNNNRLNVIDIDSLTVVDVIKVGRAPIAFGDFIGPLTDNVGGSVRGVIAEEVTCVNSNTGQDVIIQLKEEDDNSWDCEDAGLIVEPGEIINQSVTGSAK